MFFPFNTNCAIHSDRDMLKRDNIFLIFRRLLVVVINNIIDAMLLLVALVESHLLQVTAIPSLGVTVWD